MKKTHRTSPCVPRHRTFCPPPTPATRTDTYHGLPLYAQRTPAHLLSSHSCIPSSFARISFDALPTLPTTISRAGLYHCYRDTRSSSRSCAVRLACSTATIHPSPTLSSASRGCLPPRFAACTLIVVRHGWCIVVLRLFAIPACDLPLSRIAVTRLFCGFVTGFVVYMTRWTTRISLVGLCWFASTITVAAPACYLIT